MRSLAFAAAAASLAVVGCASGPSADQMAPKTRISDKQVKKDHEQCEGSALRSEAVAQEQSKQGTRLIVGGIVGGIGGLVGTAIGNSIAEQDVINQQKVACLAKKGYRAPPQPK